MKNFLKISMVAIVVAMSLMACDPPKGDTSHNKPDTTKVDSDKADLTKVDSGKLDTAVKDKTAVKKDTVKNN